MATEIHLLIDKRLYVEEDRDAVVRELRMTPLAEFTNTGSGTKVNVALPAVAYVQEAPSREAYMM